MGLFGLFKKKPPHKSANMRARRLDLSELARRLGVDVDTLLSFEPRYNELRSPNEAEAEGGYSLRNAI